MYILHKRKHGMDGPLEGKRPQLESLYCISLLKLRLIYHILHELKEKIDGPLVENNRPRKKKDFILLACHNGHLRHHRNTHTLFESEKLEHTER